MTTTSGAAPDPISQESTGSEVVRLIAFDLDGTLFNRDVVVSDRTASTLARVAALGVHLVVASGRSHRSIEDRVGHLPFMRWAVCSNGATLHDLFARRRVRADTVAADHVRDLRAAVAREVSDTVWAWEAEHGHYWTESFLAAGLHTVAASNRIPDDTPPPDTSVKLYVGHRELVSYDLLDVIAPVVPHGLCVSTSGSAFLEVTAPGVNKAKGLADLCADLGVAREQTMAFGDNVNDLEMMQWVAQGYAMANAHPRLLDVTTLRTNHSHDDDGVADTLERFFELD